MDEDELANGLEKLTAEEVNMTSCGSVNTAYPVG
jgi:hypothetical protein